MADMDLASAGNVAQDVKPVVNESVVGEGNVAPTTSPEPTEKLIPQSEVNKIVARTREQTRDRYYNQGKQDALAEYGTRQQAEPQQSQSMGGIEQISPDKIDQMIEDKINERANQEYGKRIAQDFLSKLEKAENEHPDFRDTISKLNLGAVPHIVQWANNLDNTSDVIYDLGKNPSKFANILYLSKEHPDLALSELHKLSDSIRNNKKASDKSNNVREPLSQVRPSPTGTDNGSMTVRDLRKQPWLRA